MIKGLYKSASAMIPRIKEQEAIANNLANAATPGYKKDMIFTEELSRAKMRQVPQKSDWQTPMIDQVYTEYEQGGLDRTGNPLDIAIEGNGFFVFLNQEGDQILSRAGNLQVSPEGLLINSSGDLLIGDGGPINVGNGTVSITEAGQIEVDGDAVAQIQVADVPKRNELEKAGKTGFMIPQGIELGAAVDFTIRQGYLESSNVEVIKEMVEMIVSFRNYEADAQSIKAQDDTLEKLLNNVGR